MTIKTKDMLNSQRDTSFETPFLTQYIIQAWGRQCETPTLTLNLYVDFETFSLDKNQSEIPANGDS